IGGRLLTRRLLDHLRNAEQLALGLADVDDAVHVHALVRHFLDRDHVRAPALAERARGVDHLGKATLWVLDQHVGQEQRERLVADPLARAPYRVAKAEWLLLTREARGSGAGQVLRQELEIVLSLALAQRHLELE